MRAHQHPLHIAPNTNSISVVLQVVATVAVVVLLAGVMEAHQTAGAMVEGAQAVVATQERAHQMQGEVHQCC